MSDESELIDLTQLAGMTGRCVATARRWVKLGHIPPASISRGQNVRLWRRSDIEAALKRLVYSPNGKRMEGTQS